MSTAQATVPMALSGWRLDRVLAKLFPDYSRARLQRWIRSGEVTMDGRTCRPKDTVTGGEQIALQARRQTEQPWEAESLSLDVVFSDDHLLVVNKPPGLVVHPGAGNPTSTLANALLGFDPTLASVPRAGIVHRLDKDTSGLLVVARSLRAHKGLVELIGSRKVRREYEALVVGALTGGGRIDAPIGRHRVHRTRMSAGTTGKPATTHYRIIERFAAHTYLQVMLETGRTHQIRVHLAHVGHPVLGDPVYGGRLRIPRGATPALTDALRKFRRQALHAAHLSLVHPVTGVQMDWQVPPPGDFLALLETLRAEPIPTGAAAFPW